MKLRKCVCGSKPIMYFGDFGDEHRIVYCGGCMLQSLAWWDGNKAASNWNSIIRRLKEEAKSSPKEV